MCSAGGKWSRLRRWLRPSLASGHFVERLCRSGVRLAFHACRRQREPCGDAREGLPAVCRRSQRSSEVQGFGLTQKVPVRMISIQRPNSNSHGRFGGFIVTYDVRIFVNRLGIEKPRVLPRRPEEFPSFHYSRVPSLQSLPPAVSRCGDLGPGRSSACGQFGETKPICPGRVAPRRPRPSAVGAACGRFCKTKPIGSGRIPQQLAAGTRVMADWPRNGIRKTKPISPPGAVDSCFRGGP